METQTLAENPRQGDIRGCARAAPFARCRGYIRSRAQPLQTEQPNPIDAEIDQLILKHAILVGGLELLPQSLRRVAILLPR